MQYHAEIRDLVGLRITGLPTEEQQVPDAKGFTPIVFLGTCGTYRVFSAIIKDVKIVWPINEWDHVQAEQTEDQFFCYPPMGSLEPCVGEYVAFDVRLPAIPVGEKRMFDIIHVKRREPVLDHSDPEKNWRRRWVDHFGCEPPEGEAVVYEIYTAQAPCSDIALS